MTATDLGRHLHGSRVASLGQSSPVDSPLVAQGLVSDGTDLAGSLLRSTHQHREVARTMRGILVSEKRQRQRHAATLQPHEQRHEVDRRNRRRDHHGNRGVGRGGGGPRGKAGRRYSRRPSRCSRRSPPTCAPAWTVSMLVYVLLRWLRQGRSATLDHRARSPAPVVARRVTPVLVPDRRRNSLPSRVQPRRCQPTIS